MKKLAGVLVLYTLAIVAFHAARHGRRSPQALSLLAASERAGLRDGVKDDPSLNGSLQPALEDAKGQASSMPDVAGQPVKSADPAAGCSYINLQDKGGSMEKVVVRDQGPYGDCYSAAASQMVDAYRFARHGETNYQRQTSETSASIGLSFEKNRDGDPFAGGWTCQVIDYLRQKGQDQKGRGHSKFIVGMCIGREEQFRMQRTALLAEYWDAYQAEINNRTKALQAQQNDPKAKLDPDLVNGIGERYGGNLVNDPRLASLTAIPEHMPPRNVLGDFFKYRRERFIQAVTIYQCYDADRPEDLGFVPACAAKPNPQSTPAYFRSVIDAQLRQNGLPLQIDYCDGVLRSGASYQGVDHSPQRTTFCSGLNGASTGAHASLIIGRRFAEVSRNGVKAPVCQYLVRNSWGAGKSGGKPHMLPGQEKAPSLNPPTGDLYSPDWEFVEVKGVSGKTIGKGSLWIDADVLANSVFGVDYLNDRPAAPAVAGGRPADASAGPEPAAANQAPDP